MWLKFFLLIAVSAALTWAEPPPGSRSGPYPAAGFRPKKPFHLPGEYLSPPQQQQQKQQQPSIEVTKQRVDHVAQIQSSLTTNQPHKEYLPPSKLDDEFLKVQFLPNEKQAPAFFKQPQKFNSKQPKAQQQFFAGNHQQQFQPEQYAPQAAQQYGAPGADNGQINVVYPDPRNFDKEQEDAENDDDNHRIAIEALNAAVRAYNRQTQPNRNSASDSDDNNDEDDDGEVSSDGYPYSPTQGRFRQGQYYVLGPDNAVQLVMFTATQDVQQARTNGFTAQLKYTPVGEVRDPVFRYSNSGQLVRVFRK